jgi:uncharacterized protein with FMN-binding domain
VKRLVSTAVVSASVLLAACGSSKPSFKPAGAATVTSPPAATQTTTAAPPAATQTSTAAAGAAPPSGSKRVLTGPVIDTQFGSTQVAATVRGSQLVDVRALQLPFDRPRSQSISTQAEPLLRSEALQAQSANIQLLSGATFTSEAYAQSLQGALAHR